MQAKNQNNNELFWVALGTRACGGWSEPRLDSENRSGLKGLVCSL